MRIRSASTRLLYMAATLCSAALTAGCASNHAPAAHDGPPLSAAPAEATPQLKNVMAAHFKVGAAIEPDSIENPADAALLAAQFSSLTAENKMKPGTIGVAEGQYNFGPADQIIAFAQAHGIAVRGHTLAWHYHAGDWTEAPAWFFAGDPQDPHYHDLVAARLRRYVTWSMKSSATIRTRSIVKIARGIARWGKTTLRLRSVRRARPTRTSSSISTNTAPTTQSNARSCCPWFVSYALRAYRSTA
jgi:hypothetical protein